jgi:hypothetical protein
MTSPCGTITSWQCNHQSTFLFLRTASQSAVFFIGEMMEVTFRPTDRGWTKPSKAAKYAGVSSKVFYGWLKDGLRHTKLPTGRILVQYDAIDEYLGNFEITDGEISFPDRVEQLTGSLKKKINKRR